MELISEVGDVVADEVLGHPQRCFSVSTVGDVDVVGAHPVNATLL